MAAEFTTLRPIAKIYIGVIVLAGVSVIGHSVYQLTSEPIGNRWVILALLTLLTGSFNVKVPSINAYISVSEAFVFALESCYLAHPQEQQPSSSSVWSSCFG